MTGCLPTTAMAGRLVAEWCNNAGVDTAFIDPRSPWQSGFIESFNAQFRREQLSGEIMDAMAEAKHLAEEWKTI
jgi:transposase InsO family protein